MFYVLDSNGKTYSGLFPQAKKILISNWGNIIAYWEESE